MKRFLLAAALCALAGPALADSALYPYRTAGGAQHNLAITSSTALTVPSTANYATICAKTATVNYTTDGVTVPTASVGMPLAVGGCVALPGSLLPNFRALSATGTLDVEYFK